MSNGEHEIRTPKGLRIGNRSVVDGKNMLQIKRGGCEDYISAESLVECIHNQKMSRPITENNLNWAAQKFFLRFFQKHLAKSPFSDSRNERNTQNLQSNRAVHKMFKKFFEHTLRNDHSPILRMRGQHEIPHRNLEN